jgi:hypothetical protein
MLALAVVARTSPARADDAAEPPPATPRASRTVEWGLGGIAANGGWTLEAGLLGSRGRFALGLLGTVQSPSSQLGGGLHFAGGPRFRLSGGVRLDTLLDAGIVGFGRDRKAPDGGNTSGSERNLPSVGARVGVTFLGPPASWYLTIGAAIRHVQRATVAYDVTECGSSGACLTSSRNVAYGGTMAGGYLTFGWWNTQD